MLSLRVYALIQYPQRCDRIQTRRGMFQDTAVTPLQPHGVTGQAFDEGHF